MQYSSEGIVSFLSKIMNYFCLRKTGIITLFVLLSSEKIYLMKKSLTTILLFYFVNASAQQGGKTTFNFLQIVPNARISALGGFVPAVKDHDLNIGLVNPAMLNADMNKTLAINYMNYVAGINYGLIGYAHQIKNWGTFSAGVQYINYGKFIEADATGQQTGTFSGGEYAFQMGWGHQIDSIFRIGANIKPIFSSVAGYKAFGLGIDIGGAFVHPNQLFTASFLARNIGTQFRTYANNREPLPLNVQLALSQKLKHVPIRFNLILSNLQYYNLSYSDSNAISTAEFDNSQKNRTNNLVGDNIMRHIVLGTEFLLTKNLNLRFGYNYNRRADLAVDTRTGLSGFSFGAGIKISKFILGYTHTFYHLAGGADLISLSLCFDDFKPKTK